MRWLRYLYRVPLLAWHVVIDLPLILLLTLAPWGRIRWQGEPLEYRVIRLWQGGLMRVAGFRLRRHGTPHPGATLFVANHVSWVDIVALHSQRMMGFVAKREIRGWPLVGWLAARGGSIFHQRGNTESLDGVMHAMLRRLHEGRSVGVFPEGRTRDGREVGPFHARIFTAAVQAGVVVQPVALRYGQDGDGQRQIAFRAGENFLQNFLRVLGMPPRTAQVCFLETIQPGSEEGRRRIAELARERIVTAMAGDAAQDR